MLYDKEKPNHIDTGSKIENRNPSHIPSAFFLNTKTQRHKAAIAKQISRTKYRAANIAVGK
jgi:hypothetical protein